MKFVKFLKKMFLVVLGMVFFSFSIAITITLLYYNKYGVSQFENTSFVIIKEEVSSDKYKKGDLVLVESTKIDKYNVGDEVFAYRVNSKDGSVTIEFGLVGKTNLDSKELTFENGSTYAEEYLVGKTTKIYNSIGLYLSIFQSQWGFLFIILVPSFLIFIYEIYSLIIEIKYGKHEEKSA